jgi:hypothetical protein
MVGTRGLEPPQPCGHWHLKPARLPIPPRARADTILQHTKLIKAGICPLSLCAFQDSVPTEPVQVVDILYALRKAF